MIKQSTIRAQNLRLAKLILHLYDKAGIAAVILAVQNTFFAPNSGECLKKKKKNTITNKSKHISQKCTKSQAMIEFRLK